MQVDIRSWQIEIGEEDVGHRGVIVLACVKQGGVDQTRLLLEGTVNGCDLHEVGACAHDEENVWPSPAAATFVKHLQGGLVLQARV